jgi:alcohol dehydrogenase (NADP+)
VNSILVGAGAVATQYVSGLAQSRVEVVAVCDLDRERAQALAADVDATPYTDLGTALADSSAPLVVNLTGHEAHADVTEQALRADRHVYSEKPLAMDGGRARDLVELAADRGRALGCAPINDRCVAQRHAETALADGRLGPVRLGYAHAHVGRVTEWHDHPDSFLSVGPLYDGGVYPLTLLVSWFGPVQRVRVADAVSPWPGDATRTPDRPSHVEATLAFDGPVVRLTTSMYAPHRSREFYGLELHGDDGSLYLADAGTLVAEDETVRFGGRGRAYVAMPPPTPDRERHHVDGVDRLVRSIRRDRLDDRNARRGAHVVAVCNAIETAAADGGPVPIEDYGVTARERSMPAMRPPEPPSSDDSATRTAPGNGSAIRLPPVGFGCSRYRDGEYVDRIDSIATALDTGYRLLDSAELYGNEHRIGDLLAAPGTPDRESLFVLGKVWNTNHEHVRAACTGSLAELGIDTFDCYAVHWPEAWAYQGPLERLAERPVDAQKRLAFPERDGEPATVDVPLIETWERMEALVDDGLTRTLGLCNVSLAQLDAVCEQARYPPALVQVERHPYQPRERLVSACQSRGIGVIAHSPLSAPGLLDEAVLAEVGAEQGLSRAAVVLAWNVTRGVVPIPSSNDADHVVENLAAAGRRLPADATARIDELVDPTFER